MKLDKVKSVLRIPWTFYKLAKSAVHQELNPNEGCKDLNGLCFASLSVINIRTEPKYQSAMASQALMGTPLKLHYTPQGKYWVNVETPDGCKGWVNNLAITMTDEAGLEEWKKSKRLIVTATFTEFFEGPDLNSQRLSDGVAGCIVRDALEQSRGFSKVILPDGRAAFVKTSDVADFERWADEKIQSQDTAAMQASVVATAKRFVGTPFLWRGCSAKGFDCSSFAKYVYFLSGYAIPYRETDVRYVGKRVDFESGQNQLQPADIVFFGHKAKGRHPEKIKHVALYIGDGQIIHSSHMIRINNVFDTSTPNSYIRKIIRAVRIIGYADCGMRVKSVRHSDVWFA